MGIIRIKKTKDYTVMSNYHLRDKSLSLKAKGLLSTMFSLPDEWDYSVKGLTTLAPDGETAVRSALKELEKAHYLTRTPVRVKGQIADWEYTVYEIPQKDEPQLEKPHVDFPQLENRAQLNTKELNTKELNIKKENNKENADALASTDTSRVYENIQYDSTKKTQRKQEVRHKYGEYNNVLLSDAELGKLKAEFPNDWQEWIERVSGYVAQRGKGYSNYLATIRNWARKDAQRQQASQKKGFVYNNHCEEGDSL